MQDSLTPIAAFSGAASPTFGRLDLPAFSGRVGDAADLLGSARMLLDTLAPADAVQAKLTETERGLLATAMQNIRTAVTSLIQEAKESAAEASVPLTVAADMVNETDGLLRSLAVGAARKTMSAAQDILLAIRNAADVRLGVVKPRASEDGYSKIGVIAFVAVLALLIGFAVALGGPAHARVLPTPPVAAEAGPVKVPSGRVRCTKPGEYHLTVPARTTKTDEQGHHHASVWVQEHRRGRARFLGQNKSTKPVVPVTGCINPSRIDGDHGPIYVIVEDNVDGHTSVERVFTRGGHAAVAK